MKDFMGEEKFVWKNEESKTKPSILTLELCSFRMQGRTLRLKSWSTSLPKFIERQTSAARIYWAYALFEKSFFSKTNLKSCIFITLFRSPTVMSASHWHLWEKVPFGNSVHSNIGFIWPRRPPFPVHVAKWIEHINQFNELIIWNVTCRYTYKQTYLHIVSSVDHGRTISNVQQINLNIFHQHYVVPCLGLSSVHWGVRWLWSLRLCTIPRTYTCMNVLKPVIQVKCRGEAKLPHFIGLVDPPKLPMRVAHNNCPKLFHTCLIS